MLAEEDVCAGETAAAARSHRHQAGSVAALTDSTGTVVASYSYEPFGKLTNSTGTIANPYRWLGGLGVYHDTATGLYNGHPLLRPHPRTVHAS
jgi:hypothetical protein